MDEKQTHLELVVGDYFAKLDYLIDSLSTDGADIETFQTMQDIVAVSYEIAKKISELECADNDYILQQLMCRMDKMYKIFGNLDD